MWLSLVYLCHYLDYQAERISTTWDELFPKTNPACTGDILCDHYGRHKRDCMGGLVSTNTFWRKMKKI
jgi:hypothetical protein